MGQKKELRIQDSLKKKKIRVLSSTKELFSFLCFQKKKSNEILKKPKHQ